MDLSRMGRLALTTAVIFVLAGCGGAETTSAVPQSIVASVAHHASWMQPGTSSEDLLYVTQDDGGLAVFSYPDLKLVGHLYLPEDYGDGNACSDKKGNVFIPFVNLSNQDSGVFEYSHGGTSPIKTLTGPSGYKPQGCSLDSMTGNLAVTNQYYVSEHRYGNLLIYANGTGAPTSYSDPSMSVYGDPAYDNRGNLFIAGSGSSLFALAELPKGDDTLINLAVNENGFTSIGDFMNWDGTYLAINASPGAGRFRPQLIYQVQVSGSTASVVRALHFRHWVGEGQSFSLQGAYLVSSEGGRHGGLKHVALWKYPGGGQPVMFASGHAFCWGFTVSVAPSGLHK